MKLGILGGGQLGRYIAESAKTLGIGTAVLDPAADCPAAKAADELITADVKDAKAAVELARRCDVVTLEWELIPSQVLRQVEAVKPLHPGADELHVIQDRLRQKEFLAANGFPQAPFGKAAKLPARLKTRGGGYDGKGQWRIAKPQDLEGKPADTVLEQEIAFDREFSVILTRARDGRVEWFPPAQNEHRGGILHLSRAPVDVPAEAREIAARIAERLGHVGTIAVEFFDVGGKALVNEIAPRVHNSGHWTMAGTNVSQFEQHVRAVCGLPLLPVEVKTPVVMVNLLGDLWAKGEPDWTKLEGAKLYLYGKASAKPGRKMGHFLVQGDDPARAEALFRSL